MLLQSSNVRTSDAFLITPSDTAFARRLSVTKSRPRAPMEGNAKIFSFSSISLIKLSSCCRLRASRGVRSARKVRVGACVPVGMQL